MGVKECVVSSFLSLFVSLAALCGMNELSSVVAAASFFFFALHFFWCDYVRSWVLRLT